MIQQHYEAHESMVSKQEPIILIEEEEQKQTSIAKIEPMSAPIDEWVSLKSSSQETLEQESVEQQSTEEDGTQEQGVQEIPEPEMPASSISPQAIAEALKVAQHVLGPDATSIADRETPPVSQEIQDILDQSILPMQEIKESVQQPKNNLTFAQLAQGFVKHVEQSAAIQVESSKTGVANVEQLKHLNYIKKIIDCIENSFIINTAHIPANKTLKSIAYVQLAVNKDGSIHTLTIAQSSGNTEVDRFLLYVFKDASSSFPPIPTSLQQNPYRFPLFVFDPQVRNERKLIIRCH